MPRDGGHELKCYRCGAVKPAGDFAWRRKARNQRDSFCRPCRAAYKQEHYQANRARYIAQTMARKKELYLERTRMILKYFRDHPCRDCGEDDPVVLQFDHLRDKRFEIANKLTTHSWANLLEEIAKCEVVCANCHARRTAERRRSLRWVLTAETY